MGYLVTELLGLAYACGLVVVVLVVFLLTDPD